jgi:FkbM family methyltransferase
MDNDIVYQKGLFWPSISQTLDKVPDDLMTTTHTGPRLIQSYCKSFRVCVQAGGNVGYFPKIYSEYFDVVYTFEPDPVNFYCLNKNAFEKNIIKFQTCLSNENVLLGIELPKKSSEKKGINTGTYTISQNNKIFPSLKIDNLNLPICDLIHLDIEGFEGYAIQGAINTIKRCNPIICLEINGLNEKHGWSLEKILQLMSDINYKNVYKDHSDYVFIKND